MDVEWQAAIASSVNNKRRIIAALNDAITDTETAEYDLEGLRYRTFDDPEYISSHARELELSVESLTAQIIDQISAVASEIRDLSDIAARHS